MCVTILKIYNPLIKNKFVINLISYYAMCYNKH